MTQTASEGTPRPTILIADDDPELRMLLRVHLESGDFDLIEAQDGEQALEKIIYRKPNLVILDVMMPELNGWEICKYIKSREAYSKIGIIMLTGIGATINELTSPLYGADEYIDKPFDIDELDEKIEKVLKKVGAL